MAVQDATTLKSYFNTGDVPTESQFADLIDTIDSKGSGGVTDHGALTGLSDDDHSQYLNETRHAGLDHAGLTGIPSVSGLLDETAHDLLDHTGLTGIPTVYTDEMAQDVVGAAIAAGTQSGITVTYDDANNKIDFTVTATGTGDVTGPASSVDSNFALFNGTTGKIIKDGSVKASDFATASHNHTGVYQPAGTYSTDIHSNITALNAVSGTNTGDQDLSGYSLTSHNHAGVYEPADATILKDADIGVTVQAYDADLTSWAAIAPSAKQDTLISGTNIKTINGDSVLGSGNIVIEGGSGMTNPMTTAGDIIVGGTNGAPTRLAKGTDGQVLTLASGSPAWAAASGGGAIDWSNPILVTGATTLTIGRHHVCSGTTADYTVTLPAVSGNAGKLLSVEMSGALTKLVTLDGNASETIDGTTTRVMWARETAVLLCDGTQWTKVGGKSIPMICSMYASDATSFVGLTNTKININTVIIDNSGRMADTAGFKIVIQRSGNYNIYSTLRYNQTNTSNTWVGNKTYRNGNLFLNSTSTYLASSYSDVKTSNLSSLVIGDYIEPYGNYGTGTFTTSTVVAGSTSSITLQVEEIITW